MLLGITPSTKAILGPFLDFSEEVTSKIKGTGRVYQISLFDQISDIIDHKE